MPRRRKEGAVQVVEERDYETSMDTVSRCCGPFLDGFVTWSTEPVALDRDRPAVKKPTALAKSGDCGRFFAASLRGETPGFRVPTAAGARDHRGNAIRSAILKEEFGAAVAAWASERLAGGMVAADTVRRTLNSLLR